MIKRTEPHSTPNEGSFVSRQKKDRETYFKWRGERDAYHHMSIRKSNDIISLLNNISYLYPQGNSYQGFRYVSFRFLDGSTQRPMYRGIGCHLYEWTSPSFRPTLTIVILAPPLLSLSSFVPSQEGHPCVPFTLPKGASDEILHGPSEGDPGHSTFLVFDTYLDFLKPTLGLMLSTYKLTFYTLLLHYG